MTEMTAPERIKAVAAAALESSHELVAEWLPEGRLRRSEWIARNPVRDDSSAGSFSVNCDTGRWNDYADSEARGGDLVSLFSYLQRTSQIAAAREIDRRLGLGFFRRSRATSKERAQAAQAAETSRLNALRKHRRAATERAQRQEAAARAAARTWEQGRAPCANHPYLVRKCIPAPFTASLETLRQRGNNLLIPLYAWENDRSQLANLQTIQPDGSKRFLKGGRTAECFHVFGNPHGASRLYICEGWSTGAVIHLDTSCPVICAMTAGNLADVAYIWRDIAGPDFELVIAGDDDRKGLSNPGREAAYAAAQAAGGLLTFPEWPPEAPVELSDFNDLYVWQLSQGSTSHEQA